MALAGTHSSTNMASERLRVLVIGSGGREHALAWRLAKSPSVDVVHVDPGNGGTQGDKLVTFLGVLRCPMACDNKKISVYPRKITQKKNERPRIA